MLELVGEAIEQALCPDREGPYGLYDYTNYGHPKPHHVRDFRDPRSTAYGDSVLMTTDREEAEVVYARLKREHVAQAAIAAFLKHSDQVSEHERDALRTAVEVLLRPWREVRNNDLPHIVKADELVTVDPIPALSMGDIWNARAALKGGERE